MKLVNGIKQARLKKEVRELISKISPEHLTHQNLKLALDKYLEVGAIDKEEMKVIETKLMGTRCCYRMENTFKEYGFDVMAEILFFDKDKKSEDLTLYHVAGPHLPDAWLDEFGEGYVLHDDWEKYLQGECHEILHVPDAQQDDRLHHRCRGMITKIGVQSVVYFPLFYDKERIGSLIFLSTERIDSLPEELINRIENKGEQAERELTRLQNEWFNLRIKSCKGVIGLDDVIRYISDEAIDVLGWDAETVLRGTLRSEHIHPDDQWHFYKEQLKVVEKKERVRVVYRSLHAKFEWIVLDTIFEPIIKADGTVGGIRFEAFINTPACKEFENRLSQEA